MPIIAVFEGHNLTQQNYEETVRLLTGKSRMSSPSDWPVEGLLAHGDLGDSLAEPGADRCMQPHHRRDQDGRIGLGQHLS